MLKYVDGVATEMTAEEIAAFEASRQPAPSMPARELYAAAISAHLDAAARARGYDGALSIATYVGSSVPQWAAEAVAFAAWRDAVWTYAYAELAKVQAGQRAQPTVADLIAELPAITWPA
jgi:hypothetical protein